MKENTQLNVVKILQGNNGKVIGTIADNFISDDAQTAEILENIARLYGEHIDRTANKSCEDSATVRK